MTVTDCHGPAATIVTASAQAVVGLPVAGGGDLGGKEEKKSEPGLATPSVAVAEISARAVDDTQVAQIAARRAQTIVLDGGEVVASGSRDHSRNGTGAMPSLANGWYGSAPQRKYQPG